LSDATILRCTTLHKNAEKQKCHLLVAIKDDKWFIHFSVLDNGIHKYYKFGLLDFFLWGYVKDNVYADKPTTLQELKAAITKFISNP